MKKLIASLILSAFAGVSLAQVDEGLNTKPAWTFRGVTVDSLIYENGKIVKYTYDDSGRVISKLIRDYELVEMGDDSDYALVDIVYERSFNEAGNIQFRRLKDRIVGKEEWDIDYEYLYEYGQDGRLDNMTYSFHGELWDKDIYSYDDELSKMTVTHYNYKGNDKLNMTSTADYYYDENHVLISKDSCDAEGSVPVYYRLKYAYGNDGRLMADTTFTEDGSDWAYLELNVYTYGEYGSSQYTTYKYQDGAWVYDSKRVYTYDEHFNSVDISSYSWYSDSWTQTSAFNYTYTYNEDGNPLDIERRFIVTIPYLNFISETYTKYEFSYEDSKIIEKDYRQDDDEWTQTDAITYFITKNGTTTGIETIEDTSKASDRKKVLVNGRLYIRHGDRLYTVEGIAE